MQHANKRPKKRRWKASTYRNLEGSLFIAPWVIGFLAFLAFPLGFSMLMSFHDVTITGSKGIQLESAGWKHYNYVLFQNSEIFYDQLLPFLQQQLLIIPIIVVFALLIAILLNQRFRGRMIFRVIFFLPVIFTSGETVRQFMSTSKGGSEIAQNPGDAGSFTSFIDLTSYVNSVFPAAWSGPIITILDSFVLILWYSGVQILIFLAGRQTISSSVYEAARIDGANPWEVFWKITLPGMTPFILLNLIYTVVDLFTFPTNPVLASADIAKLGQSSAIAWIYFIFILLFLGLCYLTFMRVTRSQRQTG